MENINNNSINKSNILGNSSTADSSFNNESYNTTNSYNKTIINNIYPIRKSEKDKKKEQDKIQRPYLHDKVGKIIKGYAYVSKEYKPGVYTIMNLTDINGKYIADHIQLDIKENLYNYDDYRSKFIKFIGVANEYNYKNGDVNYGIDISEPVIFLSDNIITENKLFSDEVDIDNIRQYLYNVEFNDLQKIMKTLYKRLSDLTIEFGVDFIYNYLINSYTLYNATYDLYKGELQNNKLNDLAILDLIMLLGFVIYEIECSVGNISLKNIFEYISFGCNVLQGIDTYNKHSKGFENFCLNNINDNRKALKKAWSIARYRKINFGSDPNPHNITKNRIAVSAYNILNEYIRK